MGKVLLWPECGGCPFTPVFVSSFSKEWLTSVATFVWGLIWYKSEVCGSYPRWDYEEAKEDLKHIILRQHKLMSNQSERTKNNWEYLKPEFEIKRYSVDSLLSNINSYYFPTEISTNWFFK